MHIEPYVESIRHQLEVAAETGGDEARSLAERLAAPLDSAIRLAIQDALAAAAEEITLDLAPGFVEIRLRGRDPEFVVSLPPVEGSEEGDEGLAAPMPLGGDSDDTTVARINLRLPDRLKSRVEKAADREGLSINAWLVRATAAAVERTEAVGRRPGRTARGSQHYSGWAR
jgi:hypothetical protein